MVWKPKFKVGDKVGFKTDPSAFGVIVEVNNDSDYEYDYKVQLACTTEFEVEEELRRDRRKCAKEGVL